MRKNCQTNYFSQHLYSILSVVVQVQYITLYSPSSAEEIIIYFLQMISPTLTLVIFFTVLLIPNYPGPYEEPPQQLLQSDQTWIFGGIFASTVGWRDFWALGKVVRNFFRTLFQLGAGPLQILTVTLKWAKKFCLRTFVNPNQICIKSFCKRYV